MKGNLQYKDNIVNVRNTVLLQMPVDVKRTAKMSEFIGCSFIGLYFSLQQGMSGVFFFFIATFLYLCTVDIIQLTTCHCKIYFYIHFI